MCLGILFCFKNFKIKKNQYKGNAIRNAGNSDRFVSWRVYG